MRTWDQTPGTLQSSALAEIDDTAEALFRLPGQQAEGVAKILRAAVERERERHPDAEARSILWDRRPPFLPFTDEHRELPSEFDLSVLVQDEPAQVPAALANLASLAELDLFDLAHLFEQDDSARWKAKLDHANASLAEAFSAWSQGAVTVSIEKIDAWRIRLHVSNPDGGWTQLEERSDGLKMFVALVALTATRESDSPVVLIDEIEQHLHYDAQADLIQVFTSQTTLQQIVYTTHSAGSLPEDIGDGVRCVVPVVDATRSEIVNRFWSRGTGFSPLLVGMGASTLAFVPVRNAVMAEGATELVLLPRLLREATGRRALGYQIAPASSEAPAAHIAGLDLEAPRVAWIVDGDQSGKKIAGRLARRSVASDRICYLGGEESGLIFEDCIAVDVYAAAINAEFERSGVEPRITAKDLPAKNRPKALSRWCAPRRVKVPNKVDIANRVLDQKRSTNLVEKRRAGVLVALDKEVQRAFESVPDDS